MKNKFESTYPVQVHDFIIYMYKLTLIIFFSPFSKVRNLKVLKLSDMILTSL